MKTLRVSGSRCMVVRDQCLQFWDFFICDLKLLIKVENSTEAEFEHKLLFENFCQSSR